MSTEIKKPEVVGNGNANSDVKNIIKVQEMLGQTEQETKEEYKNFVMSKFNVRMCYPLLTPAMSHEKIKQCVEKANNLKIKSVIALPGYVDFITKNIKTLEVELGVVVGYPFGEDGVNGALSQINYYNKQKVSEITVVLSIRDMLYNNFKNTDKILKKLASVGKKKTVGVMVDFSMMTDVEKEKVIKKLGNAYIDKLYLSTAQQEDSFKEGLIDLSKKLLVNKEVLVVSSVKLENEVELTKAVKKADLVLTSKALTFLEQVKSKINL